MLPALVVVDQAMKNPFQNIFDFPNKQNIALFLITRRHNSLGVLWRQGTLHFPNDSLQQQKFYSCCNIDSILQENVGELISTIDSHLDFVALEDLGANGIERFEHANEVLRRALHMRNTKTCCHL